MKKHNYKEVISNNWYMLKLLHRATKTRLFFDSIFHISRGVVQTLIYTVLFGSVVNSVQSSVLFSDILILIGSIALLTLLANAYQSWFADVYIPMNDLKIQKFVIGNVYEHASCLDIKEYDTPSFYDNYIRTLEEAQQRCIRVSNTVAQFIGTLLTSALLIGIILSVDIFILIFILIPIVPSLILGRKKNKAQYDLYIKNTRPKRKTEYVNRVMYLSKYAKDLRVSNIFRPLSNKYKYNMDKIISNVKVYGLKNTFYQFLISGGTNDVFYIIILIYISYRILVSKTLMIGDYLIIQNASASMSWRIQWLIDSYLKFAKFSPFISQFRTFMNKKPQIENMSKTEIPDIICTKIEFKNVSFSYDGIKSVLNNINITINKGDKIAIVGKNGAGKSTFIKLLLHLYQPQEGLVLFNGINIQDYNTREYRKCFSTVFQDFMLYAFDIGENIAAGEYSDDEKLDVKNAIKMVGLWEKVSSLSNDIATPISKEFAYNGFVPSGGEQQKLAIARALYNNSGIFILDEPSSALDPRAETEINNLMLNVAGDKTIILISHRLSATVNADNIYLFDEGGIAEQGNHNELLEKNGLYAEMFMKQAKLYSDNGRAMS